MCTQLCSSSFFYINFEEPGTGAQVGGLSGLGRGGLPGLGGLALDGTNPMTRSSTANPFGNTVPVSAASRPTGSNSSLFQAPRGFMIIHLMQLVYTQSCYATGPLMNSGLRMHSMPPSSGTGLGSVLGGLSAHYCVFSLICGGCSVRFFILQ